MPESLGQTFGGSELDKLPPPPDGVFDVTNVDKRPLPIKSVPPQYPLNLRYRGITGEALIVVIIDEKGVPDRIAVYRATRPEFGAAAAACIPNWTFSPAIRQGRPVRARLTVPIVFALN